MVLTARQVLLESEKNFFIQHSVKFTFDGTVLREAQLGAIAGISLIPRDTFVYLSSSFLGKEKQ